MPRSLRRTRLAGPLAALEHFASRTVASIAVNACSSAMRSGGPAMRVAITGPNESGILAEIALPIRASQPYRLTPAKPDARPSAAMRSVGGSPVMSTGAPSASNS